MPDSPPCGDDEHTAILQFGREDGVVAADDDGTILGEVLLAPHRQATKRELDDGVHPKDTQ